MCPLDPRPGLFVPGDDEGERIVRGRSALDGVSHGRKEAIMTARSSTTPFHRGGS